MGSKCEAGWVVTVGVAVRWVISQSKRRGMCVKGDRVAESTLSVPHWNLMSSSMVAVHISAVHVSHSLSAAIFSSVQPTW